MGLSRQLLRVANARLHVLLVEPPGQLAQRINAERAIRRRGWVIASTPAEADVLLVLGSPAAELRAAANRLHGAMPGPRARVEAPTNESITDALDEAALAVADDAAQQADARERSSQPAEHADMDHGEMNMAPGGIELARGGDDRDGLEMDELHLPLGPVLPLWPPGLVLTCTLHGDVVADARSEWLGESAVDAAATGHGFGNVLCAVSWVDAISATLSLAGSPARAAAVRSIRDACLDQDPTAMTRLSYERQRVERAPLLRWSLRRVAVVSELTAQPSPPFAGDAFTRMLASFDAAASELAGREVPTPEPGVLVDRLPALVRGRELSEVRLLAAGLAPALGPTAGRWAAAHAAPPEVR